MAMTGEVPAEAASKSPSARLLDLLAGWSDYVDQDEASGLVDPTLSAERIAELYQEAGAEWWELDGVEEAEAVRAFVTERILPLLLGTEPTDGQPERPVLP